MNTSNHVDVYPTTPLDRVLIFKMFMTVVWIAFLMIDKLSNGLLGIHKQEPMLYRRLLGGAYAALLYGYGRGYWNRKHNKHIRPVVEVGIVSNGLAALILFYFGGRGTWKTWRWITKGAMWFSAGAAFAITSGLVRALLGTDDPTLTN